jgi:hypothetical protein
MFICLEQSARGNQDWKMMFLKSLMCAMLVLATPFATSQTNVFSRPTTFFIKEPNQTESSVIELEIRVIGGLNGQMVWLNEKGEKVCEAVLAAAGQKFFAKNLRCVFMQGEIPPGNTITNWGWGIIKHDISLDTLPDGTVIGVVTHLGDERQPNSKSKLSLQDIEKLYGKFPSWNLPKSSK